MRQECIEAVVQAIGRSITQQEAKDIEERILRQMRTIARKDPAAWRALSGDQRMQLAADEAAKELLHEAAKKKQRVALTIVAHDRVMNRYSTLTADGMKPFKAVARVLDDADRYIKGVANEYFSGLIDAMEAIHPKFLGMVENAADAAAVVREVFGESTGNAAAAKGAKAWMETVEAMRQRFNAAGGDIGKLDYGYIPQPHDDLRILKAGQDKWAADTLPMLDRSRYIDENGVMLDDAKMLDMLKGVWETITTGGLNKLEPGKPSGVGMRANQMGESRSIHFKDAGSYLDYMREYGKGGLLSAMQGHVGRLARNIALVEEFGPNPNVQWQFLHDTARKTGGADSVGPFMVRTQNMWDVLSGKTGQVVNVRLAEVAQGARNIQTFSKLGSAFVSSITDIPTYFITTGFNRLGFAESLTNLVRAFGSETKDYANRAGLVAESVISDMNRWAEGNIGRGWTGKLASATMKASFLEAWTDALRRGFSVTMMGAIGKLSRGDWATLEAGDRARLEGAGIAETDFKVWKLATPEKWRGSDMLTVEALRNISDADLTAAGLTVRDQNRAISRLLGSIINESEFASLSSDLSTRAAVTRGTQKGTIEGEFLRSIMLFKGFPMAMLSRHWGRMADMWQSGNKASSVAYGAALTTGLTMFGALAVELKDIINGKDPRPMDSPKFWAAAFSQGGGAGVFGDILYTGLGGNNRAGSPNWTSLLGPVFGDVIDISNATLGNAGKSARGETTHTGAELLQLAKGHLPFVNLWYAKTAIDHAGLQDLQEMLSPGYLSRMQERAHKDWQQGYWWQPGQGMPARAPDMGNLTGG